MPCPHSHTPGHPLGQDLWGGQVGWFSTHALGTGIQPICASVRGARAYLRKFTLRWQRSVSVLMKIQCFINFDEWLEGKGHTFESKTTECQAGLWWEHLGRDNQVGAGGRHSSIPEHSGKRREAPDHSGQGPDSGKASYERSWSSAACCLVAG